MRIRNAKLSWHTIVRSFLMGKKVVYFRQEEPGYMELFGLDTCDACKKSMVEANTIIVDCDADFLLSKGIKDSKDLVYGECLELDDEGLTSCSLCPTVEAVCSMEDAKPCTSCGDC